MECFALGNIDRKTVDGFGDEWERFDQSELDPKEAESLFMLYFSIFPWKDLPDRAVGFDLGCGSGRWARLVAPRVGHLHCIDASAEALRVAKRNLKGIANCSFHCASVDKIPLVDNSVDFGYSLGVLHHVPDTEAGLQACVRKLKPGAPFLIYLYYAFDDRPRWYILVWHLSEKIRAVVSRLSFPLRFAVSQIIALIVYLPLARAAALLEFFGANVEKVPLAFYRHRSFYTMRTDALDRFGTRLEQRFTSGQIRAMMEAAGLEDIKFSISAPFWCAVGRKRVV